MLCHKFYPSTLAISSEQWAILRKTGIQVCGGTGQVGAAVFLQKHSPYPNIYSPVTWVSSNARNHSLPLLFFFKQCSYGCSSIWEASGTVHGHHEEEHLTLWGAAGEDVWLQLRSDGSWAVDAVNVRAFSVWHQNLPVSHRTHRKQTRQNRSCCCHRRCHCCG